MADLSPQHARRTGRRREFMTPAWQYAKKVRSRLFVDLGGPEDAVLLAGMARSGTTWTAQLLNYDGTHRVVFEPFHPQRVKLAEPFKYVQYLRADHRDEIKTAAALRILSGNVRSSWVDVENTGFVFRRRIIKEIRSNLMLRWLAGISPRMPVVLLVRHPLAVAASWLQLGWGGRGSDGRSNDLEVILAQPELLADFPVIQDVGQRIDHHDHLQRIIFQWCVFHLVPFTQFRAGELNVLFYENLVLHPEREIDNLFRRLGRPYDWARISVAINRPSRTTKSFHESPRRLLAGWQDVLDVDQIRTATSILAMFGLDSLYARESLDVVEPAAFGASSSRPLGQTQ
jgi:hypothetical protein